MRNFKTMWCTWMALCVVSIAVIVACTTVPVTAMADDSSQCTVYEGDNINDQDYTTWSSPVNSYLVSLDNGGYMRFQYGSKLEGYLVVYYDSEYNVTKTLMVDKELSLFGAFYAYGDYYYVLTGQTNEEESDTVEVYRLTKYDTSWNRISACSMCGLNTYIPFDASSARMVGTGNYILIRTGREMYETSDGYHHQACITMQVKLSTMTMTDSYSEVMNISYGYVSHSFNQFIKIEDGKIVAVDHGEGNPDSVVLINYPTTVTSGSFKSSKCTNTNLVSYSASGNYTGVAVGAFEISDTAYLVAGAQDIDADSKYSYGRNIFVAVKNKSTDSVTVNNLTDYEAQSGVTTSVPHMEQIANNKYMVLWYRDGKVYYTQIDGNGNQVGNTYSLEGKLSDCEPVVSNGKLVWYTWDDETTTFYDIDINDLSVTESKSITNGHKYTYGTVDSTTGTVTRTCSVCGNSENLYVPKSFNVYWKNASSGYYSTKLNANCEVESELPFMITVSMPESSDSSMGSYKDMVVKSSNESVVATTMSSVTSGTLTMKSEGLATITVYPAGNPSLTKEYVFRVGTTGSIDIDSCNIALSSQKYTYTGEAQTPDITVTYKDELLEEDTDYSVSVKGNVKVGTATITISGEGIFGGTATRSYEIEKIDIGEAEIELSETSYIYDGTEKTPDVESVTCNGELLSKGTDYTVRYENYVKAGTATVYIVATEDGNYKGTATASYGIEKADISDANITLSQTLYTYDGTEHKPMVESVMYNGELLYEDVDYSVFYDNYINAGKATVYIEATEDGNYKGTATAGYEIEKADISNANIMLSQTLYTYDGTEHKPMVESVMYNGESLYEDVDYSVFYDNYINAGEATVYIEATEDGNYNGTATASYEIEKADISDADITLSEYSYTYDGTAKEPTVESVTWNNRLLYEDEDYTVSYEDDTTNAGTAKVYVTATDDSNYTGTAETSFDITQADISDADVELARDSYVYDGNEKTPTVTVTYNDKKLEEDIDYTVDYSGNTEIGTATVKISAAPSGNFTGETKAYFKIIDTPLLSECTVSISDAEETDTDEYVYTYTGRTPEVKIEYEGEALNNSKYDITYGDDRADVGTYSVTVADKNDETSTVTLTYTIEAADISEAELELSRTSYTYDGTAKLPEVTVTYNDVPLVEDTDYRVSCEDNTDAGEVTVHIYAVSGGNFTGETKAEFEIEKADISEANVTLSQDSYTYDGVAKEPAVESVTLDGTELSADDYTVSYDDDNTNAGTAKVYVTAAEDSNYTGTAETSFDITQADISYAKVELERTSYVYDGNEKTPAVTVTYNDKELEEDIEYTVDYIDNAEIGTATVKISAAPNGNFTGETEAYFKIIDTPLLSECTVSISNAEDADGYTYTYTGKKYTPEVNVEYEGEVINNSKYTITYPESVNAGTYSVTVVSKEDETDKVTLAYTIKAADMSDAKVKLSQMSYDYDGTEKKPTITVTYKNATLVEGTDYTLIYAGNTNVGTATVYITAAEDSNFTGLTHTHFEITGSTKSEQPATTEQSATTEQPATTNQSGSNTTKSSTQSQKTLTVVKKPAVGTVIRNSKTNGVYKVTKSGSVSNGKITGAEVAYVKPISKKTSAVIPASITYGSVTYKVTSVAAKAFKNNKKVKSVKIGKNVKTIGASAFANCKKLKTITISSTKLKKVGKKAISGINNKAVIKVKKKYYKKYKKYFKTNTGYKTTMNIKKI